MFEYGYVVIILLIFLDGKFIVIVLVDEGWVIVYLMKGWERVLVGDDI